MEGKPLARPAASAATIGAQANKFRLKGRKRAIVALAALISVMAVVVPAMPAYAGTTHTIAVTFKTMKYRYIDDSGPFWPADMNNVAQMYGRYGAQAAGSPERWKLIGTWGAVGTSQMPDVYPWESWDCSSSNDWAENDTLCMWNVGDALHFPNGGAETRYSPTPSPAATEGKYSFTVFPTCSSTTRPNDTSPYCKNSQGQVLHSADYDTSPFNSRILLSVKAGQTITLDITLMDHDWSSPDDLICGAADGQPSSQYLVFDEATLATLDKTVNFSGGSHDGVCEVEVRLQNIDSTL
jgi:hypothetical protein